MGLRNAFVRIAGVTFEGRQDIIKESNIGDPILLVKEPDNPKDSRAIKVLNNALSPAQSIGYIPKDRTVVFHLLMDSGAIQEIQIESMGEAKNSGNIGVMINASYDYNALQRFLDMRPGGSRATEAPERNSQ
jgi:hypothetical protein